MPTVPVHVSPHISDSKSRALSDTVTFLDRPRENPLPQTLQTPTGLAILELQGTINLPPSQPGSNATSVGRIVFPHYDANDITGSTAWMKTVHLYVGKHQRLTGEVKKLPKPIAVLKKKETIDADGDGTQMRTEDQSEELEIIEIVEWKILFSTRPEPVGE